MIGYLKFFWSSNLRKFNSNKFEIKRTLQKWVTLVIKSVKKAHSAAKSASIPSSRPCSIRLLWSLDQASTHSSLSRLYSRLTCPFQAILALSRPSTCKYRSILQAPTITTLLCKWSRITSSTRRPRRSCHIWIAMRLPPTASAAWKLVCRPTPTTNIPTDTRREWTSTIVGKRSDQALLQWLHLPLHRK